MNREQWKRVLLVIAVLGTTSVETWAQKCLNEMGDFASVSSQLAATGDAAVVRHIAARYGETVIPTLRKISKPELVIESPGGAAQASLAKLGDRTAFEELRVELEGTRVRSKQSVIHKLAFVGTPEAISVLVTFLLTDDCKHCLDFGDTGEDPRIFVHRSLTMVLSNPPIERRTFEDFLDIPVWEKWWQSNKGHITVPEPENRLSDPELRCLARRAEWYDPEAVAELAEEGGKAAIPALRDLALLGYKDDPGNFNTVRGAARTALAMLGDRSEFDAIVQQLKTWDYIDALFKLRYISTRDAIDAITMDIGEIGYIEKKDADYQAQLQRHRNEFMATLAQMVKNSPLTRNDSYTDQDVELWRTWWAKNRGRAELAVTRSVP